MEALKAAVIARIVERLAWYLRKENILVLNCEVKEKSGKFEVFFKLDNNIAGLRFIKIEISKDSKEVRVYTQKTSFDLRIKRLVKRELEKVAMGLETTSQEKNSGGS